MNLSILVAVVAALFVGLGNVMPDSTKIVGDVADQATVFVMDEEEEPVPPVTPCASLTNADVGHEYKTTEPWATVWLADCTAKGVCAAGACMRYMDPLQNQPCICGSAGH
jgi:hypothetical protein